jgi:hypothetical protein
VVDVDGALKKEMRADKTSLKRTILVDSDDMELSD